MPGRNAPGLAGRSDTHASELREAVPGRGAGGAKGQGASGWETRGALGPVSPEPVPAREGGEERVPLRVCRGDGRPRHEGGGAWSKDWIQPKGDRKEG